MSLTAAEARNAVIDGAATGVPLYSIGFGLEKDDGPPLPGNVEPLLLSQVLKIPSVPTWQGVLDREKKASRTPFGPMWTHHRGDGTASRSMIPDDLGDDTESPLRDLAGSTRNSRVAAHLYDVLWVRFRRPSDMEAAIDNALTAAGEASGEDGWPDLVQLLGRAATLVAHRKDQGRLKSLQQALDSAGVRILAGRFSFAFVSLADMVASTVISSRWLRSACDADWLQRWPIGTAWMAEEWFASDVRHGQHAFEVLAPLARPV